MIKKIISVIIVVLIVLWAGLFVSEYLAVSKHKDPRFCLSHKTVEYENNKKTESCTGLGYKYYKYYENDQLKEIDFGPFFKKDKNAINNSVD